MTINISYTNSLQTAIIEFKDFPQLENCNLILWDKKKRDYGIPKDR